MSHFRASRNSMLTHFGGRFIAYILPLFSLVWQFSSHIHLTQWLSTAVDGYYNGLTALMESTVTMFGFKGAGNQTAPGVYPTDDTPAPDINLSEHPEYDIESDGGISRTALDSEHHDCDQYNRSQSLTICTNNSARNLVSPYPFAPASVVAPVEKEGSNDKRENHKCEQSIVSATVVGEVVHSTDKRATPTLAPNPSNKRERVHKYAGMRTLKLPGRQTRSVNAPSEAEIALRQIDEELAIEASMLDTHCARELAGDGIFVHLPEIHSQPGAMLYPRTARRIWRETSVGPVNPSWGNRSTRDIPTIVISKPEHTQVKRVIDESSDSAPINAPGKWGRGRSNAVFVQSRTRTATSLLHVLPTSSESAEARLSSAEAGHLESTIFEHEMLARRVKSLSKSRTSMSGWLATISAGSNSLVADHVADKAGPILRTSFAPPPLSTPPLSPADSVSSSESSTPSTPIDDFHLSSPLVEGAKTTYAPNDRRQRARCSYLGDGYEFVVAPTIPEDLLTNEIGVAC